MGKQNSYTITSLNRGGDFSLPEIQNMCIGSSFTVETLTGYNGYGLIQALMQIMHTRGKLNQILEIGSARTGFTFWRNIRSGLPNTVYTGFDYFDLPNIDLDDHTKRVIGAWPHNAGEVTTSDKDIVFHHGLGPQLSPAPMQNYGVAIHRVLGENGLYVGVHSVNASHPFALPTEVLQQSGFRATADMIVSNGDTSTWADREMHAVIAEK